MIKRFGKWLVRCLNPTEPVPLIYRAFLYYGASYRLRLLTYVVFGFVGTRVMVKPGEGLLIGMILAALLDAAASETIKHLYDLNYAAVLSILTRKALKECGINSQDKHFTFIECHGPVGNWIVDAEDSYRGQMTLSVLAPKDNVVVLAKRHGTIFPLGGYGIPLQYNNSDGGTLDAYYSSITTISLEGKVLTLKTSDGQTISYSGDTDVAKEAVTYLRERVRSSPVHR